MANNLTLTGATFDTTGEKFGTGALNGGYGISPSGVIPLSGSFTLECWVKGATNPAKVTVAMGANYVGYLGTDTSGNLIFQTAGSSANWTVNSTINLFDGFWHHIVGVAGAAAISLYHNGILVGSVSGTYASTSAYTDIGVGNHANLLNYQWPGEIDEAVVWPSAKYSANFTPASSAYLGSEGMTALWHLDGNGTDSAGIAGPSISAPSLSGTVPGASTTVSGTFANGAPTGLSQVLDGTTTAVGSPAITTASGSGTTAAGTYSYSIATPAAGSHTIQVNGTGTYASVGSPTTFTTGVVVAPDNAAIYYSPYTWLVSASSAKTINPGAYFKTVFTGSTCSLTFDLSANSTPFPELWCRIDGQPWQQVTLSSNVALTMPATTSAWPHHTLEVAVKSTSEWLNIAGSAGGSRWSPQNAAVTLTGIVLAAASTVSAPAGPAKNVLFFGDSITEGYHTVSANGSGTNDCDGSDALLGWAFMQRDLLGANVGIVGFGGTGLLNNGVLGVPPVGTSFNQLWSGQARSFSPTPDMIVINEGTNDSGAASATFQAAFTSFLNALLAAVPTCPVAVLMPFSGAQATSIQASIAAVGSNRLHYVDTTGFFNTADSVDGVHPLGVANIGAVAPKVASGLAAVLTPVAAAVNRWTHS